MWLKGIIIVHLIVLQNTISSQPLIEDKKAREPRQTRYEECCPCPGISNGVNFRNQDLLPSQKSSFLRTPLDVCPCRSESDNDGSSSIFYPSFLRGALPSERSQDVKQEPKPLLQPEVGLASSVLETLKEATDEEYKEALMRDATRSALKTTESVLLNTEPGATKSSVTIVINPRDSENEYDAIPEASHVHETRCIHGPLGGSSFESSRRNAYPRLSKQYLLLPKRKFKEPLHKSLIDMDNSPSNVHENFDVSNRNNLENKLKINPSLLRGLSSKIDGNRNSWDNTDSVMRMMSPEQCDDLNRRTKSKSSPILTLAALKNKLRDLSEMRNANRLNDNLHAVLRENRFNVIDTKHNDKAVKLPVLDLPSFETVIDKQSPLVKNILKLRDVELLPPRKTNIEELSKTNHMYPDLKVAGTEITADVATATKTLNEKSSNERDVVDRSIPDENILEEPKESEHESMTSDTSSILQLDSQEDSEDPINDNSSHIIKTMCDEAEILNSSNEKVFQNNVKTDSNEIINIDDEQNETAEENIDLEPESSNILQQINHENEHTQNEFLAEEPSESDENDCNKDRFSTVNPINLSTNMDDKDKNPSLLVAGSGNRQRSSLKDDILRKLENLRNTVKTKLSETEFDHFKETPLKFISSTSPPNYHTIIEKPVTTTDLQNLSDSLLNRDKSPRTNSEIVKKEECIIEDMNSYNISSNNDNYEMSNFQVDDNKIPSSELHQTDTHFYVSGAPSKNLSNLDDRKKTTLNLSIKDGNGNLQSSEHTCNTVSTEGYDIEDLSRKNDMFSQASNIKYNDMRPQLSDNLLRSSLSQDRRSQEVEPSVLMEEKDIKTTFQIPSLEEIRQTISNIIDEGQQEEEGFRSIDSDPLNESSNTNLVQFSNTNLRSKLPKLGISSSQSSQRNSLIPSLNTNSYKSRPELPHVASLKQLKLGSMLNNQADIFGNTLSRGKDKIISSSKPKTSFNVLGFSAKEIPTLDKIRDSLNTNTKHLFREVPHKQQQLPMSQTSRSLNSLRNGPRSYADNSVKTVQSNIKDMTVRNQGILSKSKTVSNNIFETIAKRREDMNEKLQALHIDFSDRLATIHERLLDQTNLQSVNIPTYRESGNILNLPGCDDENNLHNLVSGRQANKESNSLLKSKHSSKPDPKFTSPKSLPSKDSKNLYFLRDNSDDGYIMEQNSGLLNSNPLFNLKKLSNAQNIKNFETPRNNLEKQRGFMHPSNGQIKISFSSTTVTPVLKQKKPTQDFTKKLPLGILKQNNNNEKKNVVHSRLKVISNAYRTKFNNPEDSKHSPSELIPVRTQSTETSFKENKLSKSLQNEPNINSSLFTTKKLNSKPRLSSEHAIFNNIVEAKTPLTKPVVPLAKENQFVTNMREALRLRLANIMPTSMTSKKAENDPKPFFDAIESPSESLKTVEVLPNPLKENTSYKCTMMCVRE